MPNPAEGKPRNLQELMEYKRKVLLYNKDRVEKAKCPDCNNISLEFTGRLLDFDAAFLHCTVCNWSGWCLLKNTGLTTELCRFLEGDQCRIAKQECSHSFHEEDLRNCKLFKEAVSISHQDAYYINKEIKGEKLEV